MLTKYSVWRSSILLQKHSFCISWKKKKEVCRVLKEASKKDRIFISGWSNSLHTFKTQYVPHECLKEINKAREVDSQAMTHLTIITGTKRAPRWSPIFMDRLSHLPGCTCPSNRHRVTRAERKKNKKRGIQIHDLCLFVKARSICSETKGWISKTTQLRQQTDDVLQVVQTGSGF